MQTYEEREAARLERRLAEERKREEAAIYFRTLEQPMANALATATQARWDVEERGDPDYKSWTQFELVGPGSAKLFFSADVYKRRINVSAGVTRDLHDFARYGSDGLPGGSISVGLDQPLDKIAKDIARRLLPNARAFAVRAIQNRDSIRIQKDRVERIVQELESTGKGAGIRRRRYQGNAPGPTDTTLHLDVLQDKRWAGYGDIEVSAYEGGTVDMDLKHLPPAVALKLLGALSDYIATRGGPPCPCCEDSTARGSEPGTYCGPCQGAVCNMQPPNSGCLRPEDA